MPSIINGLFAARGGLASHGIAIAVAGDNIANANTVGFKAARAEFEDVLSGGQTPRRTVGAGSAVSAVTSIFEQGSMEPTGRALDLGIDGNGFFVLAEGAERFYTRAGNFSVDDSGYLVNPRGLAVLGFSAGGSGALEPLNVNSISQDSVATTEVTIAGNVDASAATLTNGTNDIPLVITAGTAGSAGQTTYADLNSNAEFSTVVEVFDSLGAAHTVTYFFFHTAANEYTVRGYVDSDDVDPNTTYPGMPRLLENASNVTDITLSFAGDGSRTAVGSPDITFAIPWNNQSNASTIEVTFDPFTQYSSASNILSISQDGQGVGSVVSVTVEGNGDIFAILDNGQSATVGTVGLVNFSNPEGLSRVGQTLLQQSASSGEPIVGKPNTGTFGSIESGALELSTVDIASEFVKLITLQRGFQANSRIITTINQLLNEIIQLA